VVRRLPAGNKIAYTRNNQNKAKNPYVFYCHGVAEVLSRSSYIIPSSNASKPDVFALYLLSVKLPLLVEPILKHVGLSAGRERKVYDNCLKKQSEKIPGCHLASGDFRSGRY
jgi:hypothetical protein